MRRKIEINENWFFTKERPNLTAPDFSAMQEITLPHTWNAEDGADGDDIMTEENAGMFENWSVLRAMKFIWRFRLQVRLHMCISMEQRSGIISEDFRCFGFV